VKPTANTVAARKRITMERTFDAPIEDVWELWTTKDGIESWWGPDGFRVEVRSIDLRPGGELRYAMIAVDADKIEFMKRAGMPVVIESLVRYTEVLEHQRLAYLHLADFIPGVEPYDVATLIELHPVAAGVRMVLSFDAMHDGQDGHWTRMAVMGWESELEKLRAVLSKGVTR
jgi:uncharacterized protein YndB with AHSA1/START domain